MELRDYLEGDTRIENQEYIISVGPKLKPFSKEMLKYCIPKKNKIVYFLNISSFRKVQINLFNIEENYKKYTEMLKDNPHIRNSINYYIPDSHLQDDILYKQDIMQITKKLIKLVILETTNNMTPWLVEGIIENISGDRDNILDEEKYMDWIIEKNILEIKNITDYDKLDISYFLVRYLLETTSKDKIHKIISDKNTCVEIEKTILLKAVTYYKTKQEKRIEKSLNKKVKDVEIFTGESKGTHRADIRPGMRVKIVLKKDQPTGILTEGIVGRILTHSQNHHRGIKVMLEDGQVGRVQEIIG